MSRGKIIVLLSGGLDSALLLAMTHKWGRTALFVDYGSAQNRFEEERASAIASSYGVPFETTKVRLPFLHPLSEPRFEMRTLEEIRQGPSPAYVPGRNLILLSLAASLAEQRGASCVAIGCNAEDASGFADCRPEFLIAASAALPAQIQAPLLTFSKVDILEAALQLEVPIEKTLSCYQPIEGAHCGRCDACRARSDAFEALAEPDPSPWAFVS